MFLLILCRDLVSYKEQPAMESAGAGFSTATSGSSLRLSSTVAPRIASAAETSKKGGMILAKPFATSKTPFVRRYPSSIAYGNHNMVRTH